MIFQIFSGRFIETEPDPAKIVKSLLKQLSEFYLQEGSADVYDGKLIKYYTASETDEETKKVKQYLFIEGEKIESTEGLHALAELIKIRNKRRSIMRDNYLVSDKLIDEFGYETVRIFNTLVSDYRDKYFMEAFLKTTNIELKQIDSGIFSSDKIFAVRKGEKIFRIHGTPLTDKGTTQLENELKKSMESLLKTFQDKIARTKQSFDFKYDLFYPSETSRDCELHILTLMTKNGIKMPLIGFQVLKKEKD